ncbi:hypothetical protein ABZ135_18335 [Streptomyces sp. NPDC006339]|uniref:hypothetical protein n=1 Tax=Streptomyces sp. NPDC006339 TaxID=3156755 RepID=UPI0033A3FFAB
MSEYDEYREYHDRKAAGEGQRKHAADSGGKHAKSGDPDNCMVVAPIPGIAIGLLFLLGRTLVRQTRGRTRRG